VRVVSRKKEASSKSKDLVVVGLKSVYKMKGKKLRICDLSWMSSHACVYVSFFVFLTSLVFSFTSLLLSKCLCTSHVEKIIIIVFLPWTSIFHEKRERAVRNGIR